MASKDTIENTGFILTPTVLSQRRQKVFALAAAVQQGPGADCLQRPLVPRSRFRQQLRPSVRCSK